MGTEFNHEAAHLMKPIFRHHSPRCTHDSPPIEILESRIAPAVFTVTSLSDSGAGSLRSAIDAANTTAGHNTILFHLPAPPLHGENVITLQSGLTSKGNVTITGPGAGKLIINGAGQFQIFNINDNSATTNSPSVISGLSMVNGMGGRGSGIYSAESLTLKNVVVSGGNATTGFAVDVQGNTAAGTTFTISKSLISGNNGAGGGGIGLYGVKSFNISSTVITGNTVTAGGGGGIYAGINASGTGGVITGCQILGNTATDGGGVHVTNSNPAAASKIVISNSVISGNTSTGTGLSDGGGVLINSGNTSIIGCTINNNTAASYGGGIASQGFASLTISKTNITGNRTTKTSGPAQGGAGLFIKGSGAATPTPVTITGSHFMDNVSAEDGAGLLAENGLKLSVTGSTFLSNRAADTGGGIVTFGSAANLVNLTVTGSTFAGNIASGGAAINAVGSGNTGSGDGTFTLIGSVITGSLDSGSAVDASTHAAVSIKNDTISNNVGGGYGGGLAVSISQNVTITGGLITGNIASRGGGVFLYHTKLTVEGVTITGNTALNDGGGMIVFDSTATIQVAKITANTGTTSPDISNVGSTITFV